MSIQIDFGMAKEILFYEHNMVVKGCRDAISDEWELIINQLSELCPYRKSATFVAAVGTALLAKSVNSSVDVYSLLGRGGRDDSYSARSLADKVWAKNRALLGVDLGANGANPLNNTPFNGKVRIDEISNVRNKEGFAFLTKCLDKLKQYDSDAAKSALRGFIFSRRQEFSSTFSAGEDAGDYLVVPTLVDAVKSLLSVHNEDGRCAQAVASALLASSFGTTSIDVGHVNDPDRNFPLDIVVKDTEGEIRLAVEVKDKPVETAEVLSSLEKAAKFDVYDILYLAVSSRQTQKDFIQECERARDMGCKLVVYSEWDSFVKTCLSFSSFSGPSVFAYVFQLVGKYMADLSVSQDAIDFWVSLSNR